MRVSINVLRKRQEMIMRTVGRSVLQSPTTAERVEELGRGEHQEKFSVRRFGSVFPDLDDPSGGCRPEARGGGSPRSTTVIHGNENNNNKETTTKILILLFNIIIIWKIVQRTALLLFRLVNIGLAACVPRAFIVLLHFHLCFHTR